MRRHSLFFLLAKCHFPIIFKTGLLLLPLMVTSVASSQELEARINRVENGFTFQKIVPHGNEIIRKSIDQRMKESSIHGASVAIINDGKVEWAKGYGVEHAVKAKPVTTESLFQSASIGKIITALAVLNLVEDGKIEPNEDVNSQLKRWKIEENEITELIKVTPAHLLSHTAGLTDGYGFSGYNPNGEVPTLLQILNNEPPARAKKSLTIKTEPGTMEKYSGAGYLILQLLIEDVSGLSFADYVQQHIFDPLGMKHSTYDYRPDANPDISIAAGHLSSGKPLKKKKYHVYPEKGAAGPWTTAEDLARLIIGIQAARNGVPGSILTKESTHKLLTVQLNNKGLGVNLKGVEKPEAFWHAGQNLGYTGLAYGLIEEGKGAVILINSDGGERFMQEFITSVAHEYEWPVMKSYSSLDIPQNLQSDLAGTYKNDDQTVVLSITADNDELFVKPSGFRKGYQLYRIEENRYTFQQSQDYHKLSFTFGDQGTLLTYTESVGKTVQLKKAN